MMVAELDDSEESRGVEDQLIGRFVFQRSKLIFRRKSRI